MKKCSLVITIAGTAGEEAAFYNKPSIVFTDTQYSRLSFIHRLKSLEELPKIIRLALETKVNVSELNQFVDFAMRNSFEFDELNFVTELMQTFMHGGFPMLDVPQEKVNTVLEQNRPLFEQIVNEYIKKINQIKQERKA